MSSPSKIPILIASWVLLIPLSRGDIGPMPGTERVTPVFNDADLVCKCFVQLLSTSEHSIKINGHDAIHRNVTATVVVQDRYKANGNDAKTIIVEYEEDVYRGHRVRGSHLRLQQGETALLFLKTETAKTYSFVDPFLGATPISSLPQATGEPGLPKLESALRHAALNGVRIDRLRALQLLQGFDVLDSETLSEVELFCNSDDEEIAFGALGVLLKSRTPESVERLRNTLDAYHSGEQPMALVSIGRELAQVNNYEALPNIETLSASKYTAIQLGAMDSIRLMKNVHSIPTLIKRLDDANGTVQYVAVITLAEILGKFDGDYAPTMNLFDDKPLYYRELWKRWWTDDGRKLYAPPTSLN